RIYAMAQMAGQARFLEEGERVLHQLVAQLQERGHLSVLQGHEVLTILSESPSRTVEAVGWVGRVTPAYCTSAGRALLLDHEPDAIRQLLADTPLIGLGPTTATTVDQVIERIAEAREIGAVVVDEEFERGLLAVAAPVRDWHGRIIAAVNLSGLSFRFAERLDEALDAVRASAEELSRQLAGIGPPDADPGAGSDPFDLDTGAPPTVSG
ncbi:MAG: IclR family transcriptional regulator, partial [Solirubrobacteraceae bacterium]